MPSITVKDRTEIYYKVWGPADGPVVVLSHGWPLNSDDWEAQMFFLANKGFRCIAHDRRGHGRSSQPWEGNDMDTYADDLQALFEHLDLKDVCIVGHSTGRGEVARYLGRHGSSRVRKVVFLSAICPLMLKTDTNPKGLPKSVFDGFKASMEVDRTQFFLDVPTGPFFGFNRPDAKVSEGLIRAWWQRGMMAGFKNAHDCITAFSETDLSEDVKGIDIPVLVIHGDDDQIVPFEDSAPESMKLLKHGTLKVYPGGSHALHSIVPDEINKDLYEIFKA